MSTRCFCNDVFVRCIERIETVPWDYSSQGITLFLFFVFHEECFCSSREVSVQQLAFLSVYKGILSSPFWKWCKWKLLLYFKRICEINLL